MTTHKFLAKGAIGPLSGFAWPVPAGDTPGAWVETVGPLSLCARGVHVCRPVDLAHWIHDELWELDTGGDQLEGVDCVVVQRARLVRRIERWNDAGARRFTDACVHHALAEVGPPLQDDVRDLLDDAQFMSDNAYVALAAFTSALAVSRLAGEAAADAAYRRERAWQSAWIEANLLAPRPA